MQLFDSCLNLSQASFEHDRAAMLARATDAGVLYALVCGSDLTDSQLGLALTQEYNSQEGNYPQLYNTVGFHPHQAKLWDDSSYAALAELAKSHPDLVKAVGECGLDYDRNYSTPAAQQTAFARQLDLAVELDLPVFLHQRAAHADFLALIQDYAGKVPLLVHCFTGERNELGDYIKLGCYIGITGWFCDERRGTHLAELLHLIPQDKLVVETDAPYLIPRDLPADYLPGVTKQHRRRNEAAYLPHIVESLARSLGQEAEELAAQTLQNSLRFLRIDYD